MRRCKDWLHCLTTMFYMSHCDSGCCWEKNTQSGLEEWKLTAVPVFVFFLKFPSLHLAAVSSGWFASRRVVWQLLEPVVCIFLSVLWHGSSSNCEWSVQSGRRKQSALLTKSLADCSSGRKAVTVAIKTARPGEALCCWVSWDQRRRRREYLSGENWEFFNVCVRVHYVSPPSLRLYIQCKSAGVECGGSAHRANRGEHHSWDTVTNKLLSRGRTKSRGVWQRLAVSVGNCFKSVIIPKKTLRHSHM